MCYVNWKQNRNSPEIFTHNDLDRLFDSRKAFLIARKFDFDVDENIISEIKEADRQVTTWKKLKVLMLLSTYGVASGVNTFAMNYLREMNHDEIQVDFAVYNERESPYIEEINRYGGQTFVLPPVKNLASHIEACRDIIKNGHYDVIHDNSLILTVPIMFVAKKKMYPFEFCIVMQQNL